MGPYAEVYSSRMRGNAAVLTGVKSARGSRLMAIVIGRALGTPNNTALEIRWHVALPTLDSRVSYFPVLDLYTNPPFVGDCR